MRISILIFFLITSPCYASPSVGGMDFSQLGGYTYKEEVMRKGAILRRSHTTLYYNPEKMSDLLGYETHYKSRGFCIFEHTRVNDISAALNQDLFAKILKLAQDNSDRVVVIIDWGCGDGTAVSQFGRMLKVLKIDNVRLVGYGDIYSPRWRGAPDNVEFIWDFSRELHRYFDPGEIDLVYSHLGLFHLMPSDLADHIKSLQTKMRHGAEIIADCTHMMYEGLSERLDGVFQLYDTPDTSYFRYVHTDVGAGFRFGWEYVD